MAEHKYICGDCNKEFIRNYIVSKPRNGAKTKNDVENYKTYCSKECRVKGRAKERTYKECLNCKNPYYYHKSLENKFCSNSCKRINNKCFIGITNSFYHFFFKFIFTVY